MKRILFISWALFFTASCQDSPKTQETPTDVEEQPAVQPDEGQTNTDTQLEFKKENFVTGVNNPYFTLVPGRKFTLEGSAPEGIKIHKEVLVSDRTKEIEGISAAGVQERTWFNDSLVSDIRKWYAQDKEGNVWQLGADDYEIFGGYLKSDDWSWQAGEKEAKAGIVVPFEAKVGDELNAWYNGIEEQKTEILAIDDKVTVPQGTFEKCLKIGNYGLGEEKHEEHSYYCQGAGLSLELEPASTYKLELVKVEDNLPLDSFDIKYREFKPALTEDNAKSIALDKVDGAKSVEAIRLALWENKPAYQVSILSKEDKKLTAYLNVDTGAILKLITIE